MIPVTFGHALLYSHQPPDTHRGCTMQMHRIFGITVQMHRTNWAFYGPEPTSLPVLNTSVLKILVCFNMNLTYQDNFSSYFSNTLFNWLFTDIKVAHFDICLTHVAPIYVQHDARPPRISWIICDMSPV